MELPDSGFLDRSTDDKGNSAPCSRGDNVVRFLVRPVGVPPHCKRDHHGDDVDRDGHDCFRGVSDFGHWGDEKAAYTEHLCFGIPTQSSLLHDYQHCLSTGKSKMPTGREKVTENAHSQPKRRLMNA